MENGEFVKGAWYSYQEDDHDEGRVGMQLQDLQERVMDLDERVRTVETYLSHTDEPSEGSCLEKGLSLWLIIISMVVSAIVIGVITML